MAEEIDFPIRKLLENTLLYPVVGQTKTKKLLLTELKTNNTMSPYPDTTPCNSAPERCGGCNILFNSTNKKILYVFSVPVICWQETSMAVKKRCFTPVC
jgi:hypothetical protein